MLLSFFFYFILLNSFALYPRVALNSLCIPNLPLLEAIHLQLPPRCWGCGQARLLLLSWFVQAQQELRAELHSSASHGTLRTEWFQCVKLSASVSYVPVCTPFKFGSKVLHLVFGFWVLLKRKPRESCLLTQTEMTPDRILPHIPKRLS